MAEVKWRTPSPQDLEGKKSSLFKLILIGGREVNKSGLMCRYARDASDSNQSRAVGVDFKVKTLISPDGDVVKLQIWDTAGQEKFHTITSSYYRGTSGIMFLFDLTSRQSYDAALNGWIPEALKTAGPDSAKIIIGSRNDDQTKELTEKDFQVMSENFGCPLLEVNAEDDVEVDRAFETILDIMWKKRKGKAVNV